MGKVSALEGIEMRRLRLPLVSPFRTSFGTQTTKDVLILRAVTADAEGWGECVAAQHPLYASEYVGAAMITLRDFLVPALRDLPAIDVNLVSAALDRFRGHRMSKAALEMAVWDAELRGLGMPLSRALGAVHTSVPAGVSVGIMDTLDELVTAVGAYLADGYRRIKLKIEPGWDVAAVRAIRDAFGDIPLQVDANAAYTLADVDQLRKLDDFDLLLIEQPMAEENVLGHAELARHLRTPVCLDESITSARAAADAIRLGACRVVNIKAGRVGGYLEARRVHDLCQAHDVPVWCGGMVETGLGRAANAALAALPNMRLPGDISASSRFYHQDITPPLELSDGYMSVPEGPGLGVTPDPEALAAATVHTEWLPL
ncbi:o-succinylbenzoate synthase [Streptosporangium sp. NBC_01756]|uniref:o-succinylbenzoate synthase n=1 Tax=Streptosporangium sp. NBC_01756 TaxID=2975950 RepID=UPI002DD93416|nr:o-succinylbenzoate synthase [Streptosporangium sp. NBC_01756]WSC86918.1 o-succinylbenzoate synthase [Streptosporangium sp. NBC_01756]